MQENKQENKQEVTENEEIVDQIKKDHDDKVEANKVNPIFADLANLTDKEGFDQIVADLSLFESITMQIAEIYSSTLYNKEAVALHSANNTGSKALVLNFFTQFVAECIKENKIIEVPDLAQIVTWVEEIHIDINGQLWEEEFLTSVIVPAVETISTTILDTAVGLDENGEQQEEEIVNAD